MSGAQANRLFLTNDYSIVSKYSSVKTGYFDDKILEDFVESHLKPKSWRRAPLVNRGYSARLNAMEWMIARSIVYEKIDCVISLGAGYDTLSLNLVSQGCTWIEIDLPQVVAVKSKFIKDSKIPDIDDLHPMSSDESLYISSNYHLFSCDLRDTNDLSKKLRKSLAANGSLKSPRNFAIINEVCLSYLELEEIKTILKVVVDCIREQSAWKVHYIGYEPIKAREKSQFSEVMVQHFKSLGHPLKFLPTFDDLKHLFTQQLDFNHLTISSMYQIYHNALYDRRLRKKAFELEPFDEFEEMDSYLSHYALVTGALVIKDPFFLNNRDDGPLDSFSDLNIEAVNENCGDTILLKSSFERFGHSSCILKGQTPSVLISGGFGKQLSSRESSHKHQRLNDCLILKKYQDGFKVTSLNLSEFQLDSICLDRMHGQLMALGDELVFFCGGRQSPVKSHVSNVPFTGRISKDNKLTLEHKFDLNGKQIDTCWRHKLSRFRDDRIIQVGGISTDLEYSSQPIAWNFSSDKLGFEILPLGDAKVLSRHSFGLDSRDENTLMVFGGLQTSQESRDRPVNCDESAVLWDLRDSNKPILLELESARCYGSNVHFINNNQFVNIGGISSSTGLDNYVELIDLRNMKSLRLNRKDDPICGHLMLLNASTCHFEDSKEVVTLGGGGNYFTFGTKFNQSHLIYHY